MLLGVELQIINMFGNIFLYSFDKDLMFVSSFIVQYALIIMLILQIFEILFILIILFFLSCYGIKNVMMISIVVWILCFVLFVYGDLILFGIVLLVLLMIVYGCVFDFFNIFGLVFVEQEVDFSICVSVQGFFMIMVNGVGVWVGLILSGMVVDYFLVDGVKDW